MSSMQRGNDFDNARDIAIDPDGNVHLLILTMSTDLITTTNAVSENKPEGSVFSPYVLKVPSLLDG